MEKPEESQSLFPSDSLMENEDFVHFFLGEGNDELSPLEEPNTTAFQFLVNPEGQSASKAKLDSSQISAPGESMFIPEISYSGMFPQEEQKNTSGSFGTAFRNVQFPGPSQPFVFGDQNSYDYGSFPGRENVMPQMSFPFATPHNESRMVFPNAPMPAQDSRESLGKQAIASMGDDESEERRKRRLARNRESARQSRRRKKQYLELLEEKVSQLTTEIDHLRRTHLDNASEKLRVQKRALILEMGNCLSDTTKQEDIESAIRTVNQRFGANSKERQEVMSYYFNQLQNLLVPPYTKFLLWTLEKGDSFFQDDPSMQPSLWNMISRELGLTADQEDKIRTNFKMQDNEEAREHRRRIAFSMFYLEKLYQTIVKRGERLQGQTDALHSILSPQQTLRLLLWTDRNRERLRETSANHKFNQPSSSSSVIWHDPRVQAVMNKDDSELNLDDLGVLIETIHSI